MNIHGAYERFSCTCCDRPFWGPRSAVHHVLCDSLTLMPCNIGTPGAVWCQVGPCCTEQVLDMINSLPPPAAGHDAFLRWAH
jgi:hypothetical protein